MSKNKEMESMVDLCNAEEDVAENEEDDDNGKNNSESFECSSPLVRSNNEIKRNIIFITITHPFSSSAS